jgi:DNA-directed RNA polymerase specialized sigma24 family protein
MQTQQPRFVDPAVQRAFQRHCEAARDAVWTLIRQRRPEEPENVWAEVCVRAWARFPQMYAEERLDLAAGRASRHNWTSWLMTIAANYVIDLHRHTHGRRQMECESTPTENRMARVSMVPLEADIPAIAAGDPERYVTLREGWRLVNQLVAALPADEGAAVASLIRGEDDAKVAARWGVSTRTFRRRRAQGLERLRLRLTKHGYECVGDLRAA